MPETSLTPRESIIVGEETEHPLELVRKNVHGVFIYGEKDFEDIPQPFEEKPPWWQFWNWWGRKEGHSKSKYTSPVQEKMLGPLS